GRRLARRRRRRRLARSLLLRSRAARFLRVAPGHRNAVAFCVHALRESVVVALLLRSGGGARRIGARHSSGREAYGSRGRRGLAAAKQRSGGSADRGADDGAVYGFLSGFLAGARTADLVVGVDAAIIVVAAELVEGFSGAGKHEDSGTVGRRGGARCEEQRAGDGQLFHLLGVGGTRCQPPGHSRT